MKSYLPISLSLMASAIIMIILESWSYKSAIARRLKGGAASGQRVSYGRGQSQRPADWWRNASRVAAAFVVKTLRRDYVRAVDLALQRAGMTTSAQEYLGGLMVGGLLGAIAGYFLGGGRLWVILLGVWTWYFSSLLTVVIKQAIRMARFTQQLPSALDTVTNSLRTGYSFFQALSLVAEEGSPPVSLEFQRLVKEISVGIPLEEALNGMQQRMDSGDVELLAVSVLLNRQVGGNLAELIDIISKTIRERVGMRGELKALTATGRLSGSVVALMPFALGGILWMVRRDYMTPLFNTGMGRMMLIGGGVSELIGIVIIHRIINVRF